LSVIRGLIVEGKRDKIAYKSFIDKLGYKPNIIQAGGNDNLVNNVESYAELLRDHGCRKIVALKDLDINKLKDIQQKCIGFPSDIKLVVAVKEMESWLLADESALKKQFQKPNFKPYLNPENIDDPKKELEDLYKRHKKKFISRIEIPNIVQKINLNILRKKCPSFQDFENNLK